MRIELTKKECDAAIWAVGQHTQFNAYDIKAMMREGLDRNEAKALIRVDHKLRAAYDSPAKRDDKEQKQ